MGFKPYFIHIKAMMSISFGVWASGFQLRRNAIAPPNRVPGNLTCNNLIVNTEEADVISDNAVVINGEAVVTSAWLDVSTAEAIVTSAHAVVTSTEAVVRNDEAVVRNGEAVVSNSEVAVKGMGAIAPPTHPFHRSTERSRRSPFQNPLPS